MNKKLALMTFGIATLGMNSIVLEPVSSQITTDTWNYDCYLKSNQKVVGQITLIAEAPDETLAIEACDSSFAICKEKFCKARLREKPIPPMSLDILSSYSQ